jgi:predicted nucleic acid-binding protein
VIYIDSSVVLSRVFAEAISPQETFWENPLTSSRLLMYEVWTRVYARQPRLSRRDDIETLLDRIEFLAFADHILERALYPFPTSLRTLDALHLATMHFLRGLGQAVTLASYDKRLLDAAFAMGIAAEPL